MTLKEAQELVDNWIKEYGVRYFSELTNMAVLTEEVGELARVMARKYGDQSYFSLRRGGKPRLNAVFLTTEAQKSESELSWDCWDGSGSGRNVKSPRAPHTSSRKGARRPGRAEHVPQPQSFQLNAAGRASSRG